MHFITEVEERYWSQRTLCH